MRELTPEQLERRLAPARVARGLRTGAERGARKLFDRIGARALSRMKRGPSGAPAPDVLTMRTGHLARAHRGRTDYSVERVEQAGSASAPEIVFVKGVDARPSAPGGIPGARLHELGGTTGGAVAGATMPARAHLRPAVEASRADVAPILAPHLRRALVEALTSAAA